ncbi:hypothetical protein Tco_0720738 [Tanacetum coccineum]
MHGYGHLEEIVVKRADRKLHKFKEGDFVDLHLNDIEDMLLLAVQHRLFHLGNKDIVDFIVAVRMFTRSLIIEIHVEDLQLGVESYQKKLNITAPQKTYPGIEFKELYTPSGDPARIADELYKFSYGTLKDVRDELHHRILDFCMGYNKEIPLRKWSATDKRRSELMVEMINKLMHERRIIRNQETISQNWRDLPRDNPIVSIEVLGIHNEDGNPARANINKLLGTFKDGDGKYPVPAHSSS